MWSMLARALGKYGMKNAFAGGMRGFAGMAAIGAKDVVSSAAGRRMLTGAAIGGAYGAISSDTSVLGGMAMGAVGGRYLGAGLAKAARSGAGLGFIDSTKAYGQAFAKGIRAQARYDARGAKMFANQGFRKIRGIMTGRAT